MIDYGEMTIIQQDGAPVIVGHVPDRIGVHRELLDNLDQRWGSLDGDTLTLLEHRFVRVGPSAHTPGVTVFELVRAA